MRLTLSTRWFRIITQTPPGCLPRLARLSLKTLKTLKPEKCWFHILSSFAHVSTREIMSKLSTKFRKSDERSFCLMPRTFHVRNKIGPRPIPYCDVISVWFGSGFNRLCNLVRMVRWFLCCCCCCCCWR